jgi:histone acetyltransferase
MDTAASHSLPADGGQHPRVAKRTASEEPETAPDAKRAVGFDDGLTKPDIQLPTAAWRVPIPEKVC